MPSCFKSSDKKQKNNIKYFPEPLGQQIDTGGKALT